MTRLFIVVNNSHADVGQIGSVGQFEPPKVIPLLHCCAFLVQSVFVVRHDTPILVKDLRRKKNSKLCRFLHEI